MPVRFAPSPTGRFHVGNLRTAWISHRLASATGQPWVLRFEDIDRPRVKPGARELQIQDMEALGLRPGRIYEQTSRHARHWELLEKAVRTGAVYPCSCSRKNVREALEGHASAPHSPNAIYSGACRTLSFHADPSLDPAAGWRFRNPSDLSGAHDFLVGRGAFTEAAFVPSYNWACAIDDLDGGYRLLVRAADLAQVLEQQRAVERWMLAAGEASGAIPAVFHCALVIRDDGSRLEKRTLGVTLPELAAAGYEPARLLEIFERSFTLPASLAFAPESVSGEAKAELTLGELGIRPG